MKARSIQENRQNFIEDELDDWYEDYGYYGRYYSTHIYVGMPCTYTVVRVGNATYYQCGSVWYNQVYYQGSVNYVEIAAPEGAEVISLDDPTTLKVGSKTYYISDHTFYEKIQRDGKNIYVVVDPPYGVEVDSIPDKAVEAKVDGVTYYQYDKIFYRKVSDSNKTTYIIVSSPY